MPRILIAIILVFVKLGKGLVVLKNELVMGLLYFVVLAPSAFIRKFIPARRSGFRARKTSWADVKFEED